MAYSLRISSLKPINMNLKYLVLASILLFSISSSQAQSFKFGIKAGTDINKMNGKSFKENFSYGYQLGAFAEIGVNQKWSIQPELLFGQAIFDTTSQFSDVYKLNGVLNTKLKYMKIPLLLNYKPNEVVRLQVGPQFGVLLDKEKNLLENGRSAFKEGDFSMVGGLQLNISRWVLYGRYALGLTNLNDINKEEKWKSQSFQVGLGFTF